jgi:plastocyanin
MRRSYAVAASAAVLTVLAVVWSVLVADAATRAVDVRDDEFVDSVTSASTTTIAVGDTVQWTWSGSNEHTVDNNGGTEVFSSGAPKATGTFSHTFNAAGTYNYICGIHGTAMPGTVIVEAAQAPTSTSTPQATTTPIPEATATAGPGSTNTSTPPATSTAALGDPIAASVTPSMVPDPRGDAAARSGLPATGGGSSPEGRATTALTQLAVLAALGAVVMIAMAVGFGWRRRAR